MINPLGSKILVKAVNEETTSECGIVLPSARSGNTAEVVGVGSRVKHVSVGDKVVVPGRRLAQSHRVDGMDLVLLEESEVLGVLESEP